ncbi:MAG: hypothetical protein JW910_16480 [Anaerolineae bacterium]|nr:hypothetical protein [Anaerolineae bacterium]
MSDKPFFVFDTYGDWQATKIGDYLYDSRGEYIGFCEGEEVYRQDGEWVGKISRDGRILRKRTAGRRQVHENPPARPPKPANLPARAPLAPMPAALTYDMIDVLDEDPDTFKRVSDLKKDLD